MFYTAEDRAAGLPARAWKSPAARASSKPKAGAFARTARRFLASVVIDAICDDAAS